MIEYYINWFTWIIFFGDHICYMKKLGAIRILQFSQRNGKLPLPWRNQGNYMVIPICASVLVLGAILTLNFGIHIVLLLIDVINVVGTT